jgi:hypothetical protein
MNQTYHWRPDMESKSERHDLNKQEPSKRVYQTPQLFIYGSIHEITRNVGPNGALDNGGGGGAGPKTA